MKVLPQRKPCKIWQGGKTGAGYGAIARHRGEFIQVHVKAFEDTYGPVPPGLCVLHSCDNRACYEEEHLFLGTKGDNARDAASKGRNSQQQLFKKKITLAKQTARLYYAGKDINP